MDKNTPILPQRFPDRPLDLAMERWWVAKVKPRQEKQLAADFYNDGIEYYLPLYVKNTPRPGTKHRRIFNIPLFAGYISFAQNNPHDIYTSGRVVNLIEIRHQQRFVRELNQIYYAQQGKAPLEPVGDTFAEGTPVKIIHGPFTGICGIVSKDPSSKLLILSVECLGNAALQIERSWIKQIEE
jgi:transcription antitermination factor NusG